MSDELGRSMVEVRILALPVDLWARAQEHIDELLREFTLLTAADREVPDTRHPRELLDLVDELRRDYDGMATDQQMKLVQAAKEGTPALDLTYQVPAGLAQACTRLGDALDAADRYCRSGEHLLTLATPPEALAFRQWYLGEFVGQISGQVAVPWPEWSSGRRLAEMW